ncbi:MAG: 50S ribosomal protein L19e [Candidatus Korarchaeota archaeon]
MTKLGMQKRIAARILKVGENRIYIHPEFLLDVEIAATSEEIKKFIKDGVIVRRPEKGISSFRHKILKNKKRRGQRKGHGSRKGAANARSPRKEEWIKKIRAIRKVLKKARDEKKILPREYRKLYLLAKGGAIRDKSHAESLVERAIKKRGSK